MKQKHFIDSHKGITALFVLACIGYYDQWQNATAWIYLALHGGYGLMWVLKSRIFGDSNWEQSCTLGYGMVIWASLSLYWIGGWMICAYGIDVPVWYLAACTLMWGLGVFFHFAADMQKHATLAVRRGLITDGLFARCRNTNYFGELLIYLGFGLLAMHWLPVVIVALFVLGLWMPNMRRKDASLSRYPEFAQYKANSSLFIPFVI